MGAFASCHLRLRPTSTLVYLDNEHLAFLLESAVEAPRCHLMLFHFHVATMLLHELAHSVFMVRFPDPKSKRGSLEPLHSLSPQEKEVELGSSLEVALFGAKIQPTNMEVKCKDGLVWYPWTDHQSKGPFLGVRMEWVERVWRGEEVKVELVGEMTKLLYTERVWEIKVEKQKREQKRIQAEQSRAEQSK